MKTFDELACLTGDDIGTERLLLVTAAMIGASHSSTPRQAYDWLVSTGVPGPMTPKRRTSKSCS